MDAFDDQTVVAIKVVEKSGDKKEKTGHGKKK
jgi:hypothetical protein